MEARGRVKASGAAPLFPCSRRVAAPHGFDPVRLRTPLRGSLPGTLHQHLDVPFRVGRRAAGLRASAVHRAAGPALEQLR